MWKRNLAFLLAVGLAVGIVFCAAEVAAQPAASTETVTEVAPATAPDAEAAKEDPIPEDPTLEQLLEMILRIVTDFRTLGVMGGFLALVTFLIALLRYRRIDRWLEEQGWKRYKIWVAAGLGGIMMFLTALASGTPLLKAIVAGIIGIVTGLTAVGGHQFYTKGNTKSPKKK